MSLRRFITFFIILGMLTMFCGCASTRTRTLRSPGPASACGAPLAHGAIRVEANVPPRSHRHGHYRGDAADCCIDAMRAFLLFAVIVDILSH